MLPILFNSIKPDVEPTENSESRQSASDLMALTLFKHREELIQSGTALDLSRNNIRWVETDFPSQEQEACYSEGKGALVYKAKGIVDPKNPDDGAAVTLDVSFTAVSHNPTLTYWRSKVVASDGEDTVTFDDNARLYPDRMELAPSDSVRETLLAKALIENAGAQIPVTRSNDRA